VAGALRELVAGTADAVRTRLDLALTELAEERLRLARQLMLATAALFLLGVGIVLACLWLVSVVPAEQRAALLGVLALGFVAAAALVAYRWRALARRKPPLLCATLEALHADAAALRV
jgi:uncharacterized membrane protein YqjE